MPGLGVTQASSQINALCLKNSNARGSLCVPPFMILPGDECECCNQQCPTISTCECPCGSFIGGGRLVTYQLPNGIDVKQCYPTGLAVFLATAFFPTGRNPYSCVPTSDIKCANPFPIAGAEPVGGWDEAPSLEDIVPITGYDEAGNPIYAYPDYDPSFDVPVDAALPVAEALPVEPALGGVAPVDELTPVETPIDGIPVLEAPVEEIPAVPVDTVEEAPALGGIPPEVEKFGKDGKLLDRLRDNGV